MPHMVATLRLVNRFLDRQDDLLAEGAKEAILGASTIAEAVARAGLFDAPEIANADHARRALEALPASVGAAMLGALTSAVQRDLPVVLQWKPGIASEVQVWEAVEDGVGQVGILLVTPYGRDLAASS